MGTKQQYRFQRFIPLTLIALLSVQGCSDQTDAIPSSAFLQQDQGLRADYQSSRVDVHGEVVDDTGVGVEGARIKAFDQEVYSDASGAFSLNLEKSVERGCRV